MRPEMRNLLTGMLLAVTATTGSAESVPEPPGLALIRLQTAELEQALDAAGRQQLIQSLQQRWQRQGFTPLQAVLCSDRNCGQPQPGTRLEVTALPLTEGRVSSGFSLTLEQSDPRQSHRHEQRVLPVSCVLRAEDGTRLDTRHSQMPAPAWLGKTEPDAAHLGELLASACDQTLAVAHAGSGTPREPQAIVTPFPEVTVEKRVIREDDVVPAASAATEDETAPDKVSVKQRSSKEGEERTQYVIQNPASEVIIEFGQHR